MNQGDFSADLLLFQKALLGMDRSAVSQLAEKYSSADIFVENIIVPCLEEIGAAWERGTIALAQVYMCAKICEEVLRDQFPEFREVNAASGSIAIVLLEDYHSLGKMIVRSNLLNAGYRTIDLGRMEVEEIIDYLLQNPSTQILLISVLMLPSALRVRELKRRMDEEKLTTKLVVGGAPFRLDDKLWREVGAHACGAVASDAISIVQDLLGEKP